MLLQWRLLLLLWGAGTVLFFIFFHHHPWRWFLNSHCFPRSCNRWWDYLMLVFKFDYEPEYLVSSQHKDSEWNSFSLLAGLHYAPAFTMPLIFAAPSWSTWLLVEQHEVVWIELPPSNILRTDCDAAVAIIVNPASDASSFACPFLPPPPGGYALYPPCWDHLSP